MSVREYYSLLPWNYFRVNKGEKKKRNREFRFSIFFKSEPSGDSSFFLPFCLRLSDFDFRLC